MSRLDSLSRHQRFCSSATDEMTLRHPFTMIAAGPTSCGKTTWVKNLLESDMIKPRPARIVYFYKRWQKLYDDMLDSIPNMEFVQGIFRDTDFDTSQPTLLIMDDQMREGTQSGDVCDLFTEGSHHRNVSVICMLQNLYYKGKENRTMSLNSSYLVMFKNPRDQQQVAVLARQMYPNRPQHFMTEYERATRKPYGYLFVDLKQDTPDDQRLKTDLFEPPCDPVCPADTVAYNFKRIWNTPEEHRPSSNVADNINTPQEHHPLPNVADNFNAPEAVDSDDMDIDDDCMETNYTLQKFCKHAKEDTNDMWREKVTKYETIGMDRGSAKRKAHDKTLMKRKRCFHKTLVEFMCQFYHLRNEGTMGRIFKQLDYLVDKGDDIKHAVKKVVNNHKYKFDVLFEDTSDSE